MYLLNSSLIFAGLIIIGTAIPSGCAAQSATGDDEFMGGKDMAAQEGVEVSFIKKPESSTINIYIDGQKLNGNTAYLKAGKHKVQMDDKGKELSGNIADAISNAAKAPCVVGLEAGIFLFFLLAVTCPLVDVSSSGGCLVIGWELKLEQGKRYKAVADWTEPVLKVSLFNITDQIDESLLIYFDEQLEPSP